MFVPLAAMALTIIALMCLVTFVYVEAYRAPQTRSIERCLKKLYAGPELDDGDESEDAVSRRDHLTRLRRRLGVGLDSLPEVRFDSTRADGGDDGDGGGGGGGSSGDEEDEAELDMRRRQHDCLSVGLFLYEDDDYVDCRSYCGVSDGVDYRYYQRADMLLNGRMGRAGAYCVPNDAAACNSNTSLVLFTKHGWRCMPQTRAFGGEGGNMILVCDGSLLDRATGRVWRGHVDPSLTFESVDEQLPDGRGPRFVCPPGATDEIGNALVPAPFDHLTMLQNTCASLIPRANVSIIRPDFASGECHCNRRDDAEANGSDDDESDEARYEPSLRTCVPPTRAFKPETLEIRLRDYRYDSSVSPCVEFWSSKSSIFNVADNSAAGWQDVRRTIRPCGKEHEEDHPGGSNRPAVLSTYAMYANRAIPSPYALLEASPSIRALATDGRRP